MRRAHLTLAAIGVASIMASSAFAQGAIQRDGTDAGGPGASARAAREMAPAPKPRAARKAVRGSKMTTGSASRRLHEKSGTDAGGPRVQGIPGQIR